MLIHGAEDDIKRIRIHLDDLEREAPRAAAFEISPTGPIPGTKIRAPRGAALALEEVAAAVPGTPVMRKDFLVDPVQILEARSAGASGVLLIAAMLDDTALRSMLDCATEHGLFVLLESFDEEDLARSSKLLDNPADRERAESGQLLFGVNTRILRTLHVDPERMARLAPALPAGRCVAESGLRTEADAATVADLGYRLALVGTALMRSEDPAGLVAAMRDAGGARVAA